jgi:NAD(P)-dependent dehydrogenase (short-subunit alcohol dehydrogenase family)
VTMTLDGEIALVTGAGSGIGAASASRLAAEGAAVAVTDLRVQDADRVRAEIVAAGGRAIGLPLDVADEKAIAWCVEEVTRSLGPVSVLHSNAAATQLSGGGADGEVATMSSEIWDATMAINVRGPMLLARAVLPGMIANHRGAIVNTSSGAAAAAEHTRPAYGASKAALEALTRSIATRYGPDGVRCNAIAPGLVLTETVRGPGRGLRRMRDVFARHTPSPVGSPEEVASVIAFLVSDQARYINGVVLRVDGGLLAAQPYLADFLRRGLAADEAGARSSSSTDQRSAS